VFLAIEMMQEMFVNMNPSILHELQKYHPQAFAKFVECKHSFMYKMFVDNIQRGIKAALFRLRYQYRINRADALRNCYDGNSTKPFFRRLNSD
jgi:hypothetical protein